MGLNATVLRRTVTASVVSVAVTVTPFFAAIAQTVVLNGAGATFPAPLYERYIREFQRANPNIRVNYQAIGSGGGIRQIQAGSVDFGGSDSAMTDDQLSNAHQGRGALMIPTAGGAVAITYNVPGVPSGLKLSQAASGGIFSGRITRWNDPAIASTNAGVNLPNQPIRTVVRADSSGTTFIFTNALSAQNPGFRSRVGPSSAPKWPGKPLQGRGNAGVAATVKQTPNSIGYVEASFAKSNNLPVAALQNRKGQFLLPTLANADNALDNIRFPANFRVFEGNPADGYPIVGLTWMLVYKRYDAQKLPAIQRWIEWVLTRGQSINASLEYSRIPPSVAQRALQVVKTQVRRR